jgi:GTP-binding protein
MSNSTIPEQHFVTIVGRPNVGKSTLFNHLVGKERSITSDEAGTTRDRVSEDLVWDDKELTLLDTAGYPSSGETLDESFILEQIDTMIDRSECLLFVVDGRKEITELDRKIAQKLYPESEKVLLVVNKIDPPNDLDSRKAEFFELGFSDVEAVSAQHERNLESIRDWVTDQLPDPAEPDREPEASGAIQISLVGRPNTGKSTLFNSVLGYERVMVSGEPGTTRDSVSVSFDAEGRRFQLVDTGGLVRKNRVGGALDQEIVYGALRAINYSDVVGLVLDWNERVTHQDQRIAGLIKDRYRGCVILVNKADQVDEDAEERWLDHLRDRLYFLDYAPVLFTSGEEERGLGAIFRTAIDIRDEMYRTFDREQLVNTVLDLKTTLSWPSGDAAQVILQEIEQVDVNPVTFEVTANEPELLTGNDVRYLSRTLRDKLNIEVSPVKLRITRDDDDEN